MSEVLFFEDRKPQRVLSYDSLLNGSGSSSRSALSSNTKRGGPAAWHDSDDEDLQVSLRDSSLLKKLQKIDDPSENAVIKGPEFISRLRQQ